MHKVLVSEDDFDVTKELDALKSAGVGALVSFVGIVRDNAESPDLTAMTLEHYPGMTEQEINKITDIAAKKWSLFGITVIHRVGRLHPLDNIVLVAVSSAHRQAAFDGANFIMDYLKTQAPFWKCEETSKGARWVDARDTDEDALAKWK